MKLQLRGFARKTLPISLLFLSCGGGNEQLKQDVQRQGQQIAQVQEENKALRAEIDKLSENLYCTDDDVRAFIKRCEKTPGGTAIQCSDEAVAGALAFLDKEPHVAFYLRLNGILSLTKIRDGQLTELVETANLRKSTRFLILVQPRAETAAAIEEASNVANGVFQYMRTLGLSASYPVYQNVLPCKIKAETMRRYMRRADHLQMGEPGEKEPRFRVWVFRTACGPGT